MTATLDIPLPMSITRVDHRDDVCSLCMGDACEYGCGQDFHDVVLVRRQTETGGEPK